MLLTFVGDGKCCKKTPITSVALLVPIIQPLQNLVTNMSHHMLAYIMSSHFAIPFQRRFPTRIRIYIKQGFFTDSFACP